CGARGTRGPGHYRLHLRGGSRLGGKAAVVGRRGPGHCPQNRYVRGRGGLPRHRPDGRPWAADPAERGGVVVCGQRGHQRGGEPERDRCPGARADYPGAGGMERQRGRGKGEVTMRRATTVLLLVAALLAAFFVPVLAMTPEPTHSNG